MKLWIIAALTALAGCHRSRPENRPQPSLTVVGDAAVTSTDAAPADAALPVDASPVPDAAPAAAVTCPPGTTRHEGTWTYKEGTIIAPIQWCELPDGTKHGPWRKTLANGLPVEEASYDHGQLDGLWTSYFYPDDNGRSAQGTYVHGVKDGTWQKWWGGGAIAESDVYDHGVHVSTKAFNPNGQLVQRGGFAHNVVHGTWEWFNSDGSPSMLVIYDRGKPIKAWRWKNKKRTPIPTSEIESP